MLPLCILAWSRLASFQTPSFLFPVHETERANSVAFDYLVSFPRDNVFKSLHFQEGCVPMYPLLSANLRFLQRISALAADTLASAGLA
jgi:hypothetical protein